MNFNNMGDLSINQTYSEINKEKKNSNHVTSFMSHVPESTEKTESQTVYSDSVKAYYSMYNTGCYGSYPIDSSSAKTNSDENEFVIRELTDEEFETIKSKLQAHYPNVVFNKYNVQIADKIYSTGELCRNHNIRANIDKIIDHIKTGGTAKVADKILSNKHLYNNKSVIQELPKLLSECETEEDADSKVIFMDRMLSSEKIYKNKDFMDNAWQLLEIVKPDIVKPMCIVMDEFLSDAVFYDNKEFMKKAPQILATIKNDEDARNLLVVMKKIKSSEKLSNDSDFMNNSGYIVYMARNEENLNAVVKLMDKVCSDKKLMNKSVYKKIFKDISMNAVHAFNNDSFMNYYFDNLDKIERLQCMSSDDYIEVEMKDKLLHLKVDEENNINILSEEIKKEKKGIQTSELKYADGTTKREQYRFKDKKIKKYGTQEHIKYNEGYVEIVTDKDGNVTKTLTKPSKKNPGVLVVKKQVIDKDGNITEYKDTCSVDNFGENGAQRIIKKEFVSPVGVETKQTIYELQRGKRTCYEIGDKVFTRTFKVKDSDKTETYAWGKKYEAKFNTDGIEVTAIKIDGTSETVKISKDNIDEDLLPLIKQLPGDFLYTLAKEDTKVSIDSRIQNAFFSVSENCIGISDELKNCPFTFAHEFGHLVDYIVLNNLHDDSKLKEIYEKELNIYKAQATDNNEEKIMYLIAKNHKNKDGCLTELIAETNALLSGLQADDNFLLLRAKILQENFPETIAYIANKIHDAYSA